MYSRGGAHTTPILQIKMVESERLNNVVEDKEQRDGMYDFRYELSVCTRVNLWEFELVLPLKSGFCGGLNNSSKVTHIPVPGIYTSALLCDKRDSADVTKLRTLQCGVEVVITLAYLGGP